MQLKKQKAIIIRTVFNILIQNWAIGICNVPNKGIPINSTIIIYTNSHNNVAVMQIINLDMYIDILLWPTIILFLIIPSEYSFPTKILTNIAINNPAYIMYLFTKLSIVTSLVPK